MGYSASGSLTYGYDITKAASDADWWDGAWDCCEPGEHGTHKLAEANPNTKVHTVYYEKTGDLLLVAEHHHVDESDGVHDIGQLPDGKTHNMDLLWAANVLHIDINMQQPTWRMFAKYD